MYFRLMPLALKQAFGGPAASEVILNEKKNAKKIRQLKPKT